MKLSSLLSAVAVAGLMAGAASGAHANANAFLFGYTYAPYSYGPEELILNGGATVIQASNTGWYDLTGLHLASNPDYIVGNCSIASCNGAAAYNNFFVFDLSGVSGPITSAALSAANPGSPYAGYNGAPSATYTTYDVSTAISTLVSDNSGAVGIYNDLGSGVTYGSVGVGPFDNGTQVVVNLNGAALSALTASEGGQFAIGGSLGTYTASGVPEPAAWATMLLGLGVVGAAMRRRSRAVAAAA